jgi:hypothetical protein
MSIIAFCADKIQNLGPTSKHVSGRDRCAARLAVSRHIAGSGLGILSESATAEYVRCDTLKTITGSYRDYRATATCDFAMDTKDRKLEMPLLL